MHPRIVTRDHGADQTRVRHEIVGAKLDVPTDLRAAMALTTALVLLAPAHASPAAQSPPGRSATEIARPPSCPLTPPRRRAPCRRPLASSRRPVSRASRTEAIREAPKDAADGAESIGRIAKARGVSGAPRTQDAPSSGSLEIAPGVSLLATYTGEAAADAIGGLRRGALRGPNPLRCRLFGGGSGPFRPMTPGRGLVQKIVFRLIWDPAARVEPVKIDQRFVDQAVLPFGGGFEVVHAPGHCAGQVALLWQNGRLLLAGDVFTNIVSLGNPVGLEEDEGRRSHRKLAGLTFDAIAFGHGQPIAKNAIARVRCVAG